MTNEEMLGVADIVERATNRFNAQAALHRERFDEHVKLIASMKADHEAKMVEHRAAFGARTEADAKIIAGLREESAKYKAERDHFYQREGIEQKRRMDAESERDGLLTQVQDMRAEMERLRAEVAFLKIRDREYEKALDLCDKEEQTPAECIAALQERLRASIARGDFAQMEVAALRPKYKVGDKLMSHSQSLGPEVPVTVQGIRVVYDCSVDGAKYECVVGHAERELILVASHDTEAGKAAAEAALTTEPVAEEIKVGDVVEVVSNTGLNTWIADVGSVGTVTSIETLEDSLSVRLKDVPDKKNVYGGYVSICDVRKVTT